MEHPVPKYCAAHPKLPRIHLLTVLCMWYNQAQRWYTWYSQFLTVHPKITIAHLLFLVESRYRVHLTLVVLCGIREIMITHLSTLSSIAAHLVLSVPHCKTLQNGGTIGIFSGVEVTVHRVPKYRAIHPESLCTVARRYTGNSQFLMVHPNLTVVIDNRVAVQGTPNILVLHGTPVIT